MDSITIEWKIPETPSSSWLQCDSSIVSYNLTYWPRDDPTNSTTISVNSTEDIVVKTVNELDVCTEYEFSIVVVNSIDLAGPANMTSAMTDKIPPQPVDSADVTSDSYNHLEITWSEPFSQCGAPSYTVSRRLLLNDQCDDSMADTVTWEVTGDTSIEYDDLLPYSTYEFTVLATLEGYVAETVYVIAYNSTESVSTAPPEDFTVDNTVKGKLDYTWSSPPCGDRNGAVSYDYEFGEAGGDDVQRENLIVTSKSFEDLKHYMMYEFTVCPRTVVGPGPCIFIQTRTLPSEPTGPLNVESDLGSTNQTYTIIAWEKPELINGLFLRYEIQKDNDDVIMIVEEEERIYSFSDLEPNQEYAIKVRAVSSGGNGAWDSVDVTTLPIPEPNTPEVPVTTAKNDTSISIEWPLVDDTNLGIYRITNYTVRYSSATGDEDTIDVNYITSPMVCTIAPLEPGTEYYIKVRAVNEGGPGGWSESLTESTDQTFTTCPDHFLVPGVQIGLIVVVVVILLYAVAVTFLLIQLRRKGPIRTEENGQDPYMDLRPRSEADNIYQEIAITSTTSSQKPGERRLPSSDLFHKNQNVEQFANTTQDDAGYELVLTPN
ncbi:receptor-type tyrosine-protein phosphatase F-like [Strongylocentrotus purpuratus]|uniref:Fibronectin type-III domain-containing protein n=1 Tax=Strongylocentrotus purpuratus TaxID=7668 RepID=A0A7M7T3T1_STRPU|nr:receptor-type tyrosine-protein phosphatase F-like [Strongylocentrotus purpuratus]